MIAFDFEYYEVNSLEEAWKLFQEAQNTGKKAMYYNGGTELITFARKKKVYADVMINIRNVPEFQLLEKQEEYLVIGASTPLNHIVESNFYPLLSSVLEQIADHTSRNKITIGGNINSQLMYKEAILPLLLVDATVEVYGETGLRLVSIRDIFHDELALQAGELLVSIWIAREDLHLPYDFIKRTKLSQIGYPIVSAAAIRKEGQFRVAMSGACASPFRFLEIEDCLSKSDKTFKQCVQKAVNQMSQLIIEDVNGTAAYRKFVMKQVLEDLYTSLEMVR